MVMADFTGDEAEELRRALSFHRSPERMHKIEVKLRAAMTRKGVVPEVIEKINQSMAAFALYGFPESHAISFAILAYGSAYLKVHRAPEFYASLLNNQPMGFYSSATIVADAKRHGVKVRPICVQRSHWDCTLEEDNALRLGLRLVQGLRRQAALDLMAARARQSFQSLRDFKLRVPLQKEELRTLAEIGACNALAEHRRAALWHVEKPERLDDLFSHPESACSEPNVAPRSPNPKSQIANHKSQISPLAPMDAIERVAADYRGMGLTTGPHPMALLRSELREVWRAVDLPQARHGQMVQIAGNVICRQRPGTAKGFVFISLEDETGVANAIVTPALFEKFRLVITQESFLLIRGRVQNADKVVLVQTRQVEALPQEKLIGSASHDFH
jgi:error-prone DNA polymerase